MMRLGWRDAGLALLAPALMLWLDWNGLRAWFHQDDFAWLKLAQSVDSPAALWRALLEPAAQGTVRVWSERLFFLLGWQLFGLDHRPLHLIALATQTANLLLVYWVTLRISGSRLAAAAAGLLWAASPALAVPLGWLSAYNQILCAFFVLAAFACLLRWLDTGRRAWFAAQAVFYALGFGALEIIVVYPALAAAWCWMERRRVPSAVWWLWAPAALFAAAHLWWIPKPSSGVYARHWDLSIVRTYFEYWRLALAAGPQAAPLPWLARPLAGALAAGIAAAVLLAAARQGVPRMAVFGLVWFTTTLAPVLPLRDHVSDYYLTLSAVGLAWLFAGALHAARRLGRAASGAALAAAALFVLSAASLHRATADWRYERGLLARRLYFALERAAELHPAKLIVLRDVNSDLFWGAFFDSRLLLGGRVCLDPREAERIGRPTGFEGVEAAFCAPGEIMQAARSGRLAAYRWEPDGRRLRAITKWYVHRLPGQWRQLPPLALELSSAAADRWLLRGWHQAEPGGRWMGLEAEAMLAAPTAVGQQLRVAGMRPENLLVQPVEVRVAVNGEEAGVVQIDRQHPSFDVLFPVPEVRGGTQTLRVVLRASRTDRAPGDVRELGVFLTRLAVE